MNYYFLMASLPTLALDEPPPMSEAELKALCVEHLSARDYRALVALLSDGAEATKNRFVRIWQDKETQLRNAMVRIRAARLQRDPELFLRETAGSDLSCERAAEDAYSKKTPLDREMALDRFRWEQADALAGLDPFTANAVLGYGLKFKLSSRWARIDREQGESQVEALVKRPAQDQQESKESRMEQA